MQSFDEATLVATYLVGGSRDSSYTTRVVWSGAGFVLREIEHQFEPLAPAAEVPKEAQ